MTTRRPRKLKATANNDLFGNAIYPACLQHLQDRFSVEWVHQGLKSFRVQTGSAGYNAVMDPQTPLDKAFQIYTLAMIAHFNADQESSPSEQRWTIRDQYWTLAAEWFVSNTDMLDRVDPSKKAEVVKLLPDAIRAQCSLELPCGPLCDINPRDKSKKLSLMDQTMDTLMAYGLNRKIRSLALATGEIPETEKAKPQTQTAGSIVDMLAYLETLRNNSAEPSLF
jgi:hypothetical protein